MKSAENLLAYGHRRMFESLGRLMLMVSFVFSIALLSACGNQVDLHTGLQDSDANEVLFALLQSGIDANKVSRKDGIAIQVPAESRSKALQTLQAQGLPRNKQDGMGQVFKKDTLISTPLEERARYLYALSQEIEKTLNTIDGVISSRVHIVLPERLAPGEPMTPSSAAVFIKHREDVDFQLYVPRVRSLVFNSIPGLSGDEREKVTIVALPSMKKEGPEVRLVWVGPFALDEGSVGKFHYTVIAVLVLWILSLVGLYLYLQGVPQVVRASLVKRGMLPPSNLPGLNAGGDVPGVTDASGNKVNKGS